MLVPPFDPSRDHVRGERGPVLLMFGDYECPGTAAAHRSLVELAADWPGGFRSAYRHFPLGNVHPHANGAALVAEAAAAQDAFWPMHDLLFTRSDALDVPDLLLYAGELGLDVERVLADLRDGVHGERLLADVRSALDSGALGTPALFIEGEAYDGAREPGALRAALQAA